MYMVALQLQILSTKYDPLSPYPIWCVDFHSLYETYLLIDNYLLAKYKKLTLYISHRFSVPFFQPNVEHELKLSQKEINQLMVI